MPRSLRRKIHLLFFTMLAAALSGDAAEIEFKPTASVTGSFVLLGDLAKVVDADAAHVTALSRIELFPAPSATESRLVRATAVRQLLELHGINAQQNQFTGATMIRIARARVIPSPAKPTEVPEPQIQLVFARRSIAAGETVRSSDVELRAVEKQPAGVVGFTETDNAIGQEATRPIAADHPVDSRSLRKPILVTRGQMISVVARASGVRARTSARATQDGARGDVIVVESLDTKQKYSVMVTDHQQVEVLASAVAPVSQRMAVRKETQIDVGRIVNPPRQIKAD